MALTPKFTLEIKNSQLYIKDITGVYSAANTGGYDNPGDATTDISTITGASLALTDSAGTITTYSLTTPSSLDYEGFFYYDAETLPSDDVYRAVYTVTTTGGDVTATVDYYLIAPTTYNYLASIYAKIENKINDNDKNEYIAHARTAFDFWETLKALAEKGDNNNSKVFVNNIARIAAYTK